MKLVDRLRADLARGMSRDVELRTGDAPLLDIASAADPVSAAVLITITDRLEPGVILTQRTHNLRAHAGQVAFPGGRLDSGEDAVGAALREAEEEIALDRRQVDVVGTADPYLTVTGYRVMPVLGVIAPDLPLRPSEQEVAAVFEVPLRWLLDPANHGAGSLVFRGTTRHFVEMHWFDGKATYRIWGATAAIIVNLSRRLS